MEYNNILLIKMSSLGDILHSLPFAAALRKRFPKARITWLVHPQFAGFLPEPPVIDEVIYFDKVKFNKMGLADKLSYIKQMRAKLHKRKFDLVIDLQGLFKSAVLAALSGCDNRIGYAEMREGSGLVSKAIAGSHRHDHVIERYLDVARYLGAEVIELEFPMPDITRESAAIKQRLADAGCNGDYIVMVPGARWETKVWPPEYYAELAQMLIKDGFYVVLVGGPEDVPKGATIVQKAAMPPELIDLTGKTSLRELAALIKACHLYISADTGPLHFAAALKKPLVAMYGPTKADRTGPYGSENITVIAAPVKCAGCLKKQCDDWRCMYAITPQMVYAASKIK